MVENDCFYAPKLTIASSERSRDATLYLKLLRAIESLTMASGRVLDHWGIVFNRFCEAMEQNQGSPPSRAKKKEE